MTLKQAQEGVEYVIKSIEIDDEELNSFLFTLGCYSGEHITVVNMMKNGCIIAIKNGKYHVDNPLANAIVVE